MLGEGDQLRQIQRRPRVEMLWDGIRKKNILCVDFLTKHGHHGTQGGTIVRNLLSHSMGTSTSRSKCQMLDVPKREKPAPVFTPPSASDSPELPEHGNDDLTVS